MSDASLPSTPYKGIVPYGEADAAYFFGRQTEREIITANLLASRLTLFYGASGVGKTSVLRAGVAHHLRGIARTNLAERGSPEFAVVFLSSWRADPVARLIERVQASVAQALNVPMHDQVSSRPSLPETLQIFAQRAGGDLFIILDQFEEFFLYHEEEDGEGSFAVEFPRAVNLPDLRVNFLLSLREDALAKLDRFKGRIAGLFKNYLRIDHLDRETARQAIIKPIDKFNETHPSDAYPVAIEPELVEAVLDHVKVGEDVLGQGGRGYVAAPDGANLGAARIEAPYLQLVLTRLWNEEMGIGSRLLRCETLSRLGGAKQIVRTHLDQVMTKFGEDERDTAARLFDFLVTPSGTKIAHSLADLGYFARSPLERVQPVLALLAAPEVRVLRAVPASGNQPERFEIFHDVLASAILDWRARHVQTQERAQAEKRAAFEAAEREQEAARRRELKAAQELARAQAERAEIAEKHVKERLEAASKLRRRALAALGAALAASILAGLSVVMWREAQKREQRIQELGLVLTMVINLNGTWSCNDHGTYTIEQKGRKVTWTGENPPWFRNSFDGSITDQGYIEGSWHDSPGYRAFSSGTLTLKIENPSRLVRVSQTGGFGGSIWTKN
jgi:hypothetical protein